MRRSIREKVKSWLIFIHEKESQNVVACNTLVLNWVPVCWFLRRFAPLRSLAQPHTVQLKHNVICCRRSEKREGDARSMKETWKRNFFDVIELQFHFIFSFKSTAASSCCLLKSESRQPPRRSCKLKTTTTSLAAIEIEFYACRPHEEESENFHL